MEKNKESPPRETGVEAVLSLNGAHCPPKDGPQNNEPTRLPNGRWMCNHRCANGVLTSRGKPCLHRCCRDGLKNPAKKYIQMNKRQHSKSEGTGAEVTPGFRKNDSARRPRLTQDRQKGAADRRKPDQFRDCDPGPRKERDYVDLTNVTNGRYRIGTTGLKGNEALTPARDDNNPISQHNHGISMESSNSEEDIFDENDFSELEDLPLMLRKKSELNVTEKKRVRCFTKESKAIGAPAKSFNFCTITNSILETRSSKYLRSRRQEFNFDARDK